MHLFFELQQGGLMRRSFSLRSRNFFLAIGNLGCSTVSMVHNDDLLDVVVLLFDHEDELLRRHERRNVLGDFHDIEHENFAGKFRKGLLEPLRATP